MAGDLENDVLSPHASPRAPSLDVNQKRESAVNMQISYNSKCTNPLFHMSPSSHHVHSPFVLKKDILVPGGMAALMSRDELLIEWRGQVRQFTCSVPYQAVSAVIHVFDIYRRRVVLACLNSSVEVFFFFYVSSQPARGKRRMDNHRLCRPLQLCCSLQICTWREIDATLLCCTALRYIYIYIYAEIMRLSSILIERDDDINMK